MTSLSLQACQPARAQGRLFALGGAGGRGQISGLRPNELN